MAGSRGQMVGGVRRNGPHGTWSYQLDFGRVPALRCETCGHRIWVGMRRIDACPGCGGTALRETSERRHEQKSGFATRGQAVKARAKAVGDVSAGLRRGRDDATLAEYLRAWLESLEGGKLRATSIAGYRSHVVNHLTNTTIGRTRLQDLTRQTIQTFYGEMRKSGRADGSAKPLSAASIRRIHATLHRALRDAVRDGLLPLNPADNLDLPSAERPALVCWGSEEVQKFLSYVREDRQGPLWATFAMTGARRGEVLGLKWTDLEVDRGPDGELLGGRLTIRRTRTSINGKVGEGVPKTTAGERVIAIDARMVAILERQRRLQEQDHTLLGEKWSDSGFIFTDEDGEPLRPDDVSQAFAATVRRSGLPVCRLHDLRHSHATIALNELGLPLAQVSGRLGHASPAITLGIYSHSLRRLDEVAAEAFASAVLPQEFSD